MAGRKDFYSWNGETSLKMNLILRINQIEELSPVDYDKQGSAGIDLRASGRWVIDLDREKGNQREINQESYELLPQERVLILAGIEVEIPEGYYGDVRDRSGNALYHGLHVLAGVIDPSYRGEIGILMTNTGKGLTRLQKMKESPRW